MTSAGSGALRSGMTRSCGCLHSERTAASNALRTGMPVPVRRNTKPRKSTADPATWASKSRSYGSWVNMIRRCTKVNDPRYKDWGGRGITIDPHWTNFANFLADMGERPSGMSLNRKDNDGPYAKWNCEWTTPHEQQVNSGNFKLVPDVVAEIKRLRKTGLSMRAIGEQVGLHHQNRVAGPERENQAAGQGALKPGLMA